MQIEVLEKQQQEIKVSVGEQEQDHPVDASDPMQKKRRSLLPSSLR